MAINLKTSKKELAEFFNKFDQSKLLNKEEIYGYIASLYPSLDDLYNSTFLSSANNSNRIFPDFHESIIGVHPDFYWAYFHSQDKFFVFKDDGIIAYSTYLHDTFNIQSTNDQKKFLESFKNSIVSEINELESIFQDVWDNGFLLRELATKLDRGYLEHFFKNPVKSERFISLTASNLSVFNTTEHKPIPLPLFRTVRINPYEDFLMKKEGDSAGTLGVIRCFSKSTGLSSPLYLLQALSNMASNYQKSSLKRSDLDKQNANIFLNFVRKLPNDAFLLDVNALQKTLYLSDTTVPLIKYIGVYKESLRKPYENYFNTLLKSNYFGTDYYAAYWNYSFQKDGFYNGIKFHLNNKTTDELISPISDINLNIISGTDGDLDKINLCLTQCSNAVNDAKNLKTELNYPDLDNLFELLFEYLKTYHRYINFCQEFRAEFIDYLEPREIVVI